MIILKLPNIWSDRGSVWVCLESVTDVRKKLYGAAALIFWRISPWLRFFTSLKYSMASVRFWAPCIFLQYSLLLRLLKNYINIQYYYFLLLLLLSYECIFSLIKYICIYINYSFNLLRWDTFKWQFIFWNRALYYYYYY